MPSTKSSIYIITGPTASGKSDLALELASKINGAIINADSSQVYKEAPILTNSPTFQDTNKINHYLYNFISLNYNFKVTEWIEKVLLYINQLQAKSTPIILVGGSGFYISTLLNGLSPIPDIQPKYLNQAKIKLEDLGLTKFKELLSTIDPDYTQKFVDPYRLTKAYTIYLQTNKPLTNWYTQRNPYLNQPYTFIKILPKREDLYQKINLRFKAMTTNGALEEAHQILNSKLSEIYYKKVIGLTEMIHYLQNKLTLEEAIAQASQKTRNYAKRQITWINNQFTNGVILNTSKLDSNLIFNSI